MYVGDHQLSGVHNLKWIILRDITLLSCPDCFETVLGIRNTAGLGEVVGAYASTVTHPHGIEALLNPDTAQWGLRPCEEAVLQ